MMLHRKKDHRSVVNECNLFSDNKCRFTEKSCWFNHKELEHVENEAQVSEHEEEEEQFAQSVFQKVQENLEPPIENQGEKQSQDI